VVVIDMHRALAFLSISGIAAAAQQSIDSESWRPPPSTVSGSIVDTSGAAVEGAELRLSAREGEAPLELGAAASHSNGRFELHWARRAWLVGGDQATLTVTAPGFAPTVVENVFLTPSSYDLGPLTLHEAVELRGRVRTQDGSPIAGARVYGVVGHVDAVRPELWDLAPIAVGDAAGEYACRALPPGSVTLSAAALGFADAPNSALNLLATRPNEHDFTLAPESVVALQVSTTSLEPIRDVEVGPPGLAHGMSPHFAYAATHAFWRGPSRGDEHGRVRIEGIAADARLDVRVRARGYREAFVPLRAVAQTVRLSPVTWIEVTAARTSGSAPIELYQVNVRDGSLPTSRCGLAEDAAWSFLWADSTAVEVLAPDRWRIAWNSPECFVDGGAPSAVLALATDGSAARVDLSVERPSSSVSSRLLFDPPTRVSGILRDVAGQPVSMRLGTQLGMGRPDYVVTTSDEHGRFTFAQLGGKRVWLHSVDRRWELSPNLKSLELAPGALLSDLEMLVRKREHPAPARSSVRGQLLIEGRPPARAVLLAFERNVYSHVPDHAPDALIWTGRDGRFEFTGAASDSYHVVPQRRPHFEPSGWIDFGGAFPRHGRRWPFTVTLPEAGVSQVVLRLPAEAVWSSLAPPRND
jgi:hypothetical protein